MWMIVVDRDEKRTELPPLVYREIREEKALQLYEEMKRFGYRYVYLTKVLNTHCHVE